MRNLILIPIFCIFAIMGIHIPAYAQQLSQDPLYKLVFSDEFDSLGLNHNKWNTTYHGSFNLYNTNKGTSCGMHHYGNDSTNIFDYQFDFPGENNRAYDTTGSGFIRLIYKKENITEPIVLYESCYNHTCDYTGGPSCNGGFCWVDSLVPFKYSGSMLRSKYAFKYGYIEMKYRLTNIDTSDYNAYGPNLWMWNGGTDTSQNYNEIDIFEQRGTDWRMDMNFCYRKMNPAYFISHPTGHNHLDTMKWLGKNDNGASPPYIPYTKQYTGPFNGGNWITVGCEWTPEHIDSYYNSNDTARRYPIDKLPVDQLNAMPLIIDCYMPALQYCIWPDALPDTIFNYDIDYVRVYQIQQFQGTNCANTSPQTFTTINQNSYSNILYRAVTLGGTGGSAVFNNGNFHIAAQDSVVLKEGFEVSGTANVTISTMKCQTDQKLIYSNSKDVGFDDKDLIDLLKECKKH